MLARAVALEAAGRAAGEPPVAVLPPPWYGFSLHHMRFPGTVTLGSETFILMVKDICRSIIRHGFRRILLLNGHGGRSEEHTSELQSLMRTSYDVFCLKNKT